MSAVQNQKTMSCDTQLEELSTVQKMLKPLTIGNENNTNGTTNLPQKRVYKVVLTGGPCGGKTTGQARLSAFFEKLGWKVFSVPETATVLLSGGISFAHLSEAAAYRFQENLLLTMLQIENTYFEVAQTYEQNCLVICDRGAMDASAFVSKSEWERMMKQNGLNTLDLRDNRYDQVLYLVSAANGAEQFYSTAGHSCRTENALLAREMDRKAAISWIGHPYFDVIDNSTNFEHKIQRMIEAICHKMGLELGEHATTRKLKFLVRAMPADDDFQGFQDFDVVHHYLRTSGTGEQVRLRKRGQAGKWSYTHTVRLPAQQGKRKIELKTQVQQQDYERLLELQDEAHYAILKKRRCFLYKNQYYQLDIYLEPCHPRCKDLMLLETYSSLSGKSIMEKYLPDFMHVVADVSDDAKYSMYNLSLKGEWQDMNIFNGVRSGENGKQNDYELQMKQGDVYTNGNGNAIEGEQ